MSFAALQNPGQPRTGDIALGPRELANVLERHRDAIGTFTECPWITSAATPGEQLLLEDLSRGLKLAPGGAVLVSGGRTMLGEPELTVYLLEGQTVRLYSIVCGADPQVNAIARELLPAERQQELSAFVGEPLPADSSGMSAPQMPAPESQAPFQVTEVQAVEAPQAQVSFLEFEQRVLARENAVLSHFDSAVGRYR